MKHIAFALILEITLSSCGTLGGGKPVDWPAIAKCVPNASDLVTSVSRILLQGGQDGQTLEQDAVSDLEQLAAQYGPPVVACVIDQLANAWTSPAASPNETRLAGAQRGRAFLASKGTKTTWSEAQ